MEHEKKGEIKEEKREEPQEDHHANEESGDAKPQHERDTRHHIEHQKHAEHKEHTERRKKHDETFNPISLVLLGFLILILLFNHLKIIEINKGIGQKILESEEAARPARIQLTAITDSKCSDCYSIGPVLTALKAANNVTSEKNLNYESDDAKKLIKDYGIRKVPALIVTGETAKANPQGFTQQGEALLFSQQTPPYLDADSGKVVGRVQATIINATACTQCSNAGLVISQLKASAVAITKQTLIDSESEEGRQAMAKYKIQKLPALLLSEDAKYYELITGIWSRIGTVEEDGTHVFREVSPPYYDPATNKTEGLARLTMINDSSCKECYDVTTHVGILEGGFGVELVSKKTVDVSSAEGKALIAKYSITAVPTIVVEEATVYEGLKNVWPNVGTIEKDGAIIFRNFGNWKGNTYRNLTTGKIEANPAAEG
ncbi:hypothetical protein HYY74_05820 [Candidatus Woesearchaeota archaeon]|nr:hypothetical protein [Candidatus Woesearchaeota archaeon]